VIDARSQPASASPDRLDGDFMASWVDSNRAGADLTSRLIRHGMLVGPGQFD
jgi:hypothetical protein